MHWKRHVIIGWAFVLCGGFSVMATNEPVVSTWVTCDTSYWKAICGDPWPAKKLCADFKAIGITQIYFFDQNGHNGGFYHHTRVTNAVSLAPGLDYLEALLTAADEQSIGVWLAWSPPRTRQPGKDYLGLNHPQLRKIYKDVIDEVAQNYGRHPSLRGILWHEVNNTENVDTHKADLDDFKAYCRQTFGEAYQGTEPPKTNPDDIWWRRFYLYRNHVVTSFLKDMAERTAAGKLKTAFCYYGPESGGGEPWRWGYDILALEALSDQMWIAGWADASKFNYSIRNSLIDFGPGYAKQRLPLNYIHMFTGLPISYFSAYYPVYVAETRKRYSALKDWTAAYGDFYTGHYGMSEKAVTLYFGQTNIANWIGLANRWYGGRSVATAAIAIQQVPFMMRFPFAPGTPYAEKVANLQVALAQSLDVDGLMIGSAAMPETLRRYPLVIVPEEMAMDLNPASYQNLRQYVEGDGKLLVINSPVSTSRPDLTGRKDLTGELCGLQIKGKQLPGYLEIAAGQFAVTLPPKKFWAETSEIQPDKAVVLVRHKHTQAPLLTRHALGKGEVYFSAMGFKPEIAGYFQSLARTLAAPAVALVDNQDLRIVETVRNDKALAVALFGKGSARLQVNPALAGLTGTDFQVRDILTGTVVAPGATAEALKQGIPFTITYDDQPMILAIGAPAVMASFKGIYPDAKVFQGQNEKKEDRPVIENPEVLILVPEGKGPAVGIYHGGLGALPIRQALEKQSGLRAFMLPRLDATALQAADVVIVPQCNGRFFNQAIPELRKFAERGKGVLLLHDAVGYRGLKPAFPEIAAGSGNPYAFTAKITQAHPVVAGLAPGDTFTHGYYDHVAMEKGSNGVTLMAGDRQQPVLIAGTLGKGRVVLCGFLMGWDVKTPGDRSSGEGEKTPAGPELQLIVNAIRWLAGETEAK